MAMAEIAVYGSDGAANINLKKEIDSFSKPGETKKPLLKIIKRSLQIPIRSCPRFVDDVIKPSETRQKLPRIFLLGSKRENHPAKSTATPRFSGRLLWN
jgi:acetyl-CoA carboxylase carboxyltransferase component